MKMKQENQTDGVIKSILTGFLILVLHIFLIMGIGILVLFFRGIITYMFHIFICGSAVIMLSAYFLYKRMKKEGKNLRDALSLPVFSGKKVEISFLGGLASLKIENPGNARALETRVANPKLQLEDSEMILLRDLNELVRLFEDNLITLDEYNQAKQKIFHS